MTKLERAAKIVIKQCLAVNKNESVLVLADDPYMEIARVIWKEVLILKAKGFLLQVPILKNRILEPFEPVSKLMKEVNIVIALTTQSLFHSNARSTACSSGVRFISVSALNTESFVRVQKTDFEEMCIKSRKISDILSIGHEATLTSPNGTDLIIPIQRRKGFANTGLVHKPGQFSNLPAGEACVSPVEGRTNGTLIVDSGMGLKKTDNEKITISVRNGKAIRITGEQGAEGLRKLLHYYGSAARNIAKLGIGTNNTAKLCWDPLEDSKVVGTVHIALGNNSAYGGTVHVPIHVEGIIHKPTLKIDGKIITENGRLMIS